MSTPAAVSSLPFTPIIARPLPHTVVPFANETVASYTDRLAAANQTKARLLRAPSRWLGCSLNELELLRILSDQPRTSLAWALPELRCHAPDIAPVPKRLGVTTRFACRRCVAQSGSTMPITVHVATHFENVCIKHNLWVGTGITTHRHQLDLTTVPQVVRAQIALNRLVRRHGEPFMTECYRHCDRLWTNLDKRGLVRSDAEELLDRLCEIDVPDVRYRLGSFDRRRQASRYPQVVKFTAMIASRTLRRIARGSSEDAEREVPDEFARRFPLDYSPRSITGPWIRDALATLAKRMDAYARLLKLSETGELPLSLLP
ncbi:hypothetical protein ACFWZY_08635 [Streptomyces sp. NPDC058992]|uniref:hypothetical protein n=1 Tax=Streptomyces sp. NPDC058992 TaxID=3346688 RepID=UPI00368B4689